MKQSILVPRTRILMLSLHLIGETGRVACKIQIHLPAIVHNFHHEALQYVHTEKQSSICLLGSVRSGPYFAA